MNLKGITTKKDSPKETDATDLPFNEWRTRKPWPSPTDDEGNEGEL